MDRAAEQAACLESWLCRTFIDDRPAHLFAALNGARNCEQHARIAQERMGGRGTIRYGDLPDGTLHAVYVVDGWAVDNGALSPLRIFPEKDLARFMHLNPGGTP